MTRRVLVIEDNEQNLYLMRFLLEKNGCTVLGATDGPRGVAAALEWRPQLILLDIQLPGMDGYAVAAALRGHAELAGVPIIAVTSHGRRPAAHPRRRGRRLHRKAHRPGNLCR